MWIVLNDKDFYSDCSNYGIRLRFKKNVDEKLRKEIIKFCRWLRKEYWFPISCNIIVFPCPYFKKKDSKDIDSHGDFYYSSDDSLGKHPFIWIASGQDGRKTRKEYYFEDILHLIAHELTHYFQWYFNQFDIRSNRSLEIEANKWANYLVDKYLSSL